VVNGLRRIMRGMRLAAGATQSKSGVSAAQLFVLANLSRHEVLSINDLAGLTLTDRSSVAAVVDRLIARGLVERMASARDRRRAEVRMTRAGRRLLESTPPAPTTLLVSALATVPDAQLRAMARSLNSLVTALGLEGSPAPLMFSDELASG
jgi:DNA-binding MarR family transcriptional regulator